MKKCEECEWFCAPNECRKRAPVVITDGYEVGGCGNLTVYPETNPSGWCGEFEEVK